MKFIYFLLITSLLCLVSCGEMDNLASFSKRKYLKKVPKQNTHLEETQLDIPIYASNEKEVRGANIMSNAQQIVLSDQQQVTSVMLVKKMVSAKFEPIIKKHERMFLLRNEQIKYKSTVNNSNTNNKGSGNSFFWYLKMYLLLFAICFLVISIYAFATFKKYGFYGTPVYVWWNIILLLSLICAAIWIIALEVYS